MLRWLKFSVVALVGCGFLAMIGYALWMRDEISRVQMEPPLISAPDVPVKRRPDEPGGMEIPNRDKMVFDLLDSSGTMALAAQDTLPPPSNTVPVARAVTLGEAIHAAPVSPGVAVSTSLAVVPSAAVTAASSRALSATIVADRMALAHMVSEGMEGGRAGSVTTIASSSPPDAAVTSGVAILNKPPLAAALANKPVNVSVSVLPARALMVTPTVLNSWGVQVGAVGTQAEAATLVSRLQQANAQLHGLTPHTPGVMVAGTARVRVQFFGLKDRAGATKLCGKLANKQPCFPVAGK